jgi:hypothetical protein
VDLLMFGKSVDSSRMREMHISEEQVAIEKGVTSTLKLSRARVRA